MEYWINVYKTTRQPYHVSPCWESRRAAEYDYEMTFPGQGYLHTIHVKNGTATMFKLG